MTENRSEICFVIVFNHKYEQNLVKLRKLYKERFRNVLFLMPFYTGNDKDVIPVYEDSRYFQGFFQQAFHKFYNPQKFSHYVFIADDLLLNPEINENNILAELGLDSESGFIRNISKLSNLYYLYIHITGVMHQFRNLPNELRNELPLGFELAIKKEKYKLLPDKLGFKNLKHWNGKIKFKDFINYPGFWKAPFYLLKKRELPYPLVNAYSDFIIIPTDAIQQFCHLSGVMAATNLWVEYAIPTAMLISCKKIITELEMGENFMSDKTATKHGANGWKGTLLFNKKELQDFENLNQNKLENLLKSFKEKELYFHPVKLSKWE